MIAVNRRTDGVDPLLLPPRDQPYFLQDVYEKIIHGCRDELILDLGDCFLRFRVDIDTDTLTSGFQQGRFDPKKDFTSIRAADPWKRHVTQPCGWTWLGINQQGYLDSVLLSFEGIEPSVLLQAIASSIEIFVITPANQAIGAGKKSASKKSAKTKG